MCPDHVHETRGGRLLCQSCYADRKAKRQEARGKHRHHDEDEAGDTSFAAIEAALEEEEDVDGAALTLSGHRGPQPWKLCLYIAGAGLAAVLLLLIFPTLRRAPLGGDSYLPTPYFLIAVPVMAIVWGVVGIMSEEQYPYRMHCFSGIGLALLTIVLCVVAVSTDPAARAELDAAVQRNQRDNMTPDELRKWRDDRLRKYEVQQ